MFTPKLNVMEEATIMERGDKDAGGTYFPGGNGTRFQV